MEKDRLLGTPALSLLTAGLLFCLCSCSLPRILVLNDPLTPQEHINLGVACERSGELDEALKEYEKASRTLPTAYLYMGNVLFQKGEFPKAEECYREAIDRTGDPRAYNNLAWLYYSTDKNLDEAERLAGKAAELSPDKEEFKDTLQKIREKTVTNDQITITR
ncbi:MAG: Tetratricopeptide repeat protein [Syntrophorhabdus sp. PtaB.Bin184]|jgi:tetratricopeptide (TPR) repeat protein|nr:MAG: Tetratricopeptide repeat protein [Syntrophorhabdus sp. PtaB.Bin184]